MTVRTTKTVRWGRGMITVMTDRDLWRFERACREAQLSRHVNQTMPVVRGEARAEVVHDDCLETLKLMPDCCVDAVVTDPPSAIKFMGATWDSNKGGRDQWIAWLESVMREALRVLKPGGHAFVWALPRTSHWTGMAIERAGFEVRDVVTHLFGTGMPKSRNVSKDIDRKMGTTDQRQVQHTYQAGGNAGMSVTSGGCEESRAWDGYGTGLKPSAEFWWLARKPFKGTLVDNVLAHGCGCLHVDACRVSTDWTERPPSWHASGYSAKPDEEKIAAPPGTGIQCHPAGRWPSNLVLSHADCSWRCVAGCPVRVLGEQSVTKTGTEHSPKKSSGGSSGFFFDGVNNGIRDFGDPGDCSRFFPKFRASPLDDAPPFLYQSKPSRRERDRGCEHLPKLTRGQATRRKDGSAALNCPRTGAGRSGGARNSHTTVKAVALCRHLCRLVCPPGGLVVDLFSGSASVGVAAVVEGFRYLGFELNDSTSEPYCTIARARLAHALSWTQPAPDPASKSKQGSLF